jgi:hypothetical protein
MIQITMLKTLFIVCEYNNSFYKHITGNVALVIFAWVCQGCTNNMLISHALIFVKKYLLISKLAKTIQIFMQFNIFNILYKTYMAFNTNESKVLKLDSS